MMMMMKNLQIYITVYTDAIDENRTIISDLHSKEAGLNTRILLTVYKSFIKSNKSIEFLWMLFKISSDERRELNKLVSRRAVNWK